MKTLTLDSGKLKPASCVDVQGDAQFFTAETGGDTFTQLIQFECPDVVVFETCTAAGSVAELCEELGVGFFVTNPNGEAWRRSKMKRKIDRDDAFKLARLTALHQSSTVHVPSRAVRAKRSLLKFRQSPDVESRTGRILTNPTTLWQVPYDFNFTTPKSGICSVSQFCREYPER